MFEFAATITKTMKNTKCVAMGDERLMSSDKIKKQRNDSLTQFLDTNRKDPAAIEKTE
jgi:uncharacterized protein YqeY